MPTEARIVIVTTEATEKCGEAIAVTEMTDAEAEEAGTGMMIGEEEDLGILVATTWEWGEEEE